MLLAIAYFEDQSYCEAARQLEAALEMKPGYAEAHCNLGVVRHVQARVAEAEEHYRLALDQDSTWWRPCPDSAPSCAPSASRARGSATSRAPCAATRDGTTRATTSASPTTGCRTTGAPSPIWRTWWRGRPTIPGPSQAVAQSYFARGLTLLQARQPGRAIGFFHRSFALREHADVVYAEGVAHLRLEDLDAAGQAFAAAVRLDSNTCRRSTTWPTSSTAPAGPRRPSATTSARPCSPPTSTGSRRARNAAWDDSYLFE